MVTVAVLEVFDIEVQIDNRKLYNVKYRRLKINWETMVEFNFSVMVVCCSAIKKRQKGKL